VDADAIVIGGGAAGLAAARSLARRSLRVVLVEARERVGGRVWSQPVARTATPAELGAEFIHGRAPHTMALLREAGMTAIPTGGSSWILEGGELRPDSGDFIAAGSMLAGAQTLAADESVERFLARFKDDPSMAEVTRAARAFVEGFEAADPAIASVQSIAAEWRSGVDLTSARPRGGYGPMMERLRTDCTAAGVRIATSTIVRRVAWRRGAVAIQVRGASGRSSTMHARVAVVTLPAGVLRRAGAKGEIAFEPDLPAAKRDALASIEMGRVVKASLAFRTAFWERVANGRYRDAGFFRCEAGPFPAYWTQFPVRSALVVAWAGGPHATALGGVTPARLIESARDGFAALFGDAALARKEFDGGVVHEWDRDRFARGAYSYVAVGGTNARAALAAPLDDALFFAGEATSTDGQGGTVNGALETGERAAAQAARHLG
jgi:monoamine oxidase